MDVQRDFFKPAEIVVVDDTPANLKVLMYTLEAGG